MKRAESGIIYAAAWALVALGYTLALAADGTISLHTAFVAGTSTTLVAALLGLAIAPICARLSARHHPAHSLAIHAAAATIYSIVWNALVLLQLWWFTRDQEVHDFVRDGLAWQLVMGVVLYAVVAGISYARIARRNEAEQRGATERSERLRLQAELTALRARLDPHFLFNVLQTVGSLIDGQPGDAHHALDRVGALLSRRLRGDPTEDLTSLGEELIDAREYLSLESLRLGERLSIEERIDGATLPLLLPKFTLQPILENAVRHGIAPRALPGAITISSQVRDGRWILEVSNSGGSGCAAPGHGIGLRTVRDRLALHFGDRVTTRAEWTERDGGRVAIEVVLVNGATTLADDDG